jgi:hypothetical protein
MHFQYSGIYLKDNQSGYEKMEENKKDKKPLIGVSILAVVLLVLGSLSNVVGYQSVKSTVSDSPLFKTRTQRATNRQQDIIASQYLGKGNLWQFPSRDTKTELMKKVIGAIRKMDEKAFAQFTELCIQRAKQDSTLRDTNSNDIIRTLIILRTTPELIIDIQSNGYNQDAAPSGGISIYLWFPGCYLVNIIIVLFYIVFLYITSWLTYSLTCSPGSFCGTRCIKN